MKKSPPLTICIPTYNSSRFLKENLESIVNQDYTNFEIVISDNASTDDTEEIVKSFNNKKIKFFRNPVTIGLTCRNYNERIGEIKTEFIAFYHSDDIYEKEIARKEVEFLLSHPEASAVFTLGILINEKDKRIGEFQLPEELRGKELYNFMDIFRALLKTAECPIICPTFMARKKIFEEVGLFDEKRFKRAADVEMWLRISKKYQIGILKEDLIRYRRSSTQGSQEYQKLRAESAEKADFFFVMDYYLTNLKGQIENKLLRQYEYNKNYDEIIRVKYLLIKNNIREAKKILNKSFSFNLFRAFFEDFGVKKLKTMVFRIILFIGVNLGFGRYLGWLLHKRLLYKQEQLKL